MPLVVAGGFTTRLRVGRALRSAARVVGTRRIGRIPRGSGEPRVDDEHLALLLRRGRHCLKRRGGLRRPCPDPTLGRGDPALDPSHDVLGCVFNAHTPRSGGIDPRRLVRSGVVAERLSRRWRPTLAREPRKRHVRRITCQ